MKAGFSAGAIAGAVCLYANTRNRRRPPLAYRRLLGFLWRPVAAAWATSSILALGFHTMDPLDFAAQLVGVLDSQETQRFITVWWIHTGIYLGLIASIVWIILDIVRLRKRAAAEAGFSSPS